MNTSIDGLFKRHFPKLAAEFSLKDAQRDTVRKLLNGRSTMAILPTGGGKSLIYWLAGNALNGCTIVVSPLIALIDEQVSKIQEQGLKAVALHSGVSADRQLDFLRQFARGEADVDFLFLSPERLATDGFLEYCVRQRKDQIKLITIDEIHCISQWGPDFRPFYRHIPDFLNRVFGSDWPLRLGLTATLNPKALSEACTDFRICQTDVKISDLIVRGEIELRVLKFQDEAQKEEKLWQLLEIHRGEPTLVYVYRKYAKRGVEDLCGKATESGHKATHFHGDMSAHQRQEIIEDFRSGKCAVVFATNAFGMGIDIPGIRVVIHYMIPESMEQYYQEVGRAARNNTTACAYMLYSNKNVDVRRTHFIDRSFPAMEDLPKLYRKLTGNKIGYRSLKYFDDEEIQSVLPYFIACSAISIKARAFTNLDVFTDVKDPRLARLQESTTTKGFVTTVRKADIRPADLCEIAYSAVAAGTARVARTIDKCLLIESHREELTAADLEAIRLDIEEKRQYKHDLLDYLAGVLDCELSSKELHQEMGLYLGVDRHKLDRIYKTSKGDLVRSKSEVVIANLLYGEKIDYAYEEKLFYTQKDWIEPDFTIRLNGKTFYWEHLGMLGLESYDERWLKKLSIYRKHFPKMHYVTYESAHLSQSAIQLLEQMRHDAMV